MPLISDSAVWKKLAEHYRQVSAVHMQDLFTADERRGEQFSCASENIFVDYSKNRLTQTTLELLCELARAAEIEFWRKCLFDGEVVNHSSRSPALHPMFRGSGRHAGVAEEVRVSQSHMLGLAEAIRNGERTSYSNKRFTDIVQIGIGGSCIGPSFACHALLHLKRTDIHIHFISGCDSYQTQAVLNKLPVESTLFLVVSKSFTTPETLLNAEYAKNWINEHYHDSKAWCKHFIAVSANADKVREFGFSEDGFCSIPKDIGGRYSVWSAAALSLAICIGRQQFEQFLAGARSMDNHFLERDLEENLPVLLAMIGVWYASFFHAGSRVVLAYDYALRELPVYIQQLEMESNGKSVTREGQMCNYQTVPVVWGGLGLDGQHSFYQMLHQGTQLVPADFIMAEQALTAIPEYETTVRTNFLAQMRALMLGGGSNSQQSNTGNQPSNAILLKEISPYVLGELLALYEHRTFIQAFVWQINPFDQGGVELGKQISADLLPVMRGDNEALSLDSSTRGLIKRLSHRH